jgi:hypothetical protein
MMNYLLSLAGYSQNSWTTAKNINQEFGATVTKVLLKLLVLITILWGINISGLQALNLIPFFGVTILLIAIGFSPIALGATALAGGITRVDQIKGMPTGIPAGAQIWIAQVLPAIIVSCHILIGFLATWSFAANPIAFWYFAMACVTICSAVLAWKKMEGDFLYKLVLGYNVVVAIFALLATQLPGIEKWTSHEGRVEIEVQQVAALRQAEVEDAVQEAIVANAVQAAQAATPTSLSNVSAGCSQHRRYANLTYCWEVTLPPSTYYVHTLDPAIDIPRCDRHFPASRDLVRTYPSDSSTMIKNTGNSVQEILVYEVFAGEVGPDNKSC